MSQRTAFRIGAACAVVGGVLGAIFNLLHPRSSNIDNVGVELRVISENGEWLFVHIGLLTSLVVVFLGVVAIAVSLYDERGLWARAALYAAVASVPVGLIAVGIDGIAMKEMADLYAGQPFEVQTEYELAAEGAFQIGVALFDVLIISLFGLTPILAGIALAGSRTYPRGLGQASVAAGILGLITGFIQSFTGLEPLTANILFPIASLAFTLVLVVAGVTLWRKADDVAPIGVERGVSEEPARHRA